MGGFTLSDFLAVLRRWVLGQPRLALALVAGVVAVVLGCPVPVLDEESYLDIARQLDASRPYDWWRPWPPWGADREADAFVYAHPPGFLWWAHGWWRLGGAVPAVKVAAGVPWALLLGWGVGRLAERTTRQPWLAVAVWLASPVTILGLQRGLMPDLMVCALATYSVVAWIEADRTEGIDRTRWLRGSGLSLALACLTKYPAVFVLPVLLLHARRRRKKVHVWFWLALAAPVLVVEGWLWFVYGRPHLWEVLSRAHEIPRGSVLGRGLGVGTRLALGVSLLPICLPPLRRLVLPSLVLAGCLVLAGAPDGTDTHDLVLLTLLGGVGVAGVLLLGREWFSPLAPRSDVSEGDGLLLGGWGLAVVLGVVATHNFAAPRYLLPAMAPIALVLVRVVEQGRGWRSVVWSAAAIQGVLALAITVAEHRFFLAGDAVARDVAASSQDAGLFTGEWSFRSRMEQSGWSLLSTTDPTSGDFIAGVSESSPAEVDPTWHEVGRYRAGRFPLRVVDSAEGVGLYGETIGALPLGWRRGHLEEAILWRIP